MPRATRPLHPSAGATRETRRQIERSPATHRAIAAEYDVNVKAAVKRRKRETTADAPIVPKRRAPLKHPIDMRFGPNLRTHEDGGAGLRFVY